MKVPTLWGYFTVTGWNQDLGRHWALLAGVHPFCLFCSGKLSQLGLGHLGTDRLMSDRPKGGKRGGDGHSLTAGRAVSTPAVALKARLYRPEQ